MNRTLHRSFVVCAFAALTVAAAEHGRPVVNDGPGLSLRVTNESAPAGSIVQIKLEVTEPKPISTGRGKVKTRGVSSVQGIALMNKGQDTYGVAMVDEGELTISVESPSSLFGTAADYPILGIAGRLAAAPSGSSFPITLDPAGLAFRDATGSVYPTEVKDGSITIANNAVTISDVKPGSSLVPAGGVVHIYGANFTPLTRIDVGEANIAQQRFISSSQIDVVVAAPINMHGERIRARNDEKNARSESEYFSYERTALVTSNDPVLRKAVPLFAPATYTSAIVSLPVRASSSGRRRAAGPAYGGSGTPSSADAGIALQNLNASSATAIVELLDRNGNPYGVNTIVVGPDHTVVREISEVFGKVTPPAALRVRSNVPIQVLGLVVDRGPGTVTALPPH